MRIRDIPTIGVTLYALGGHGYSQPHPPHVPELPMTPDPQTVNIIHTEVTSPSLSPRMFMTRQINEAERKPGVIEIVSFIVP